MIELKITELLFND